MDGTDRPRKRLTFGPWIVIGMPVALQLALMYVFLRYRSPFSPLEEGRSVLGTASVVFYALVMTTVIMATFYTMAERWHERRTKDESEKPWPF